MTQLSYDEGKSMKLDLFAQQHRVLEDMPTTSLTLATFLRALVWSASRGFDVWSLQESWLGARAPGSKTSPSKANDASTSTTGTGSVTIQAPGFEEDEVPSITAEALFHSVLDTWEAGHELKDDKKQKARRCSQMAGSLMGVAARASQMRRPDTADESDANEDSELDQSGEADDQRISRGGRRAGAARRSCPGTSSSAASGRPCATPCRTCTPSRPCSSGRPR